MMPFKGQSTENFLTQEAKAAGEGQSRATPEQVKFLEANGYKVENMEEMFGDEYEGRFRWMLGDAEDWGNESYSIADAWAAALRHSKVNEMEPA